MTNKKYTFFLLVLLITLLTSSIIYATDDSGNYTMSVNDANTVTDSVQSSQEVLEKSVEKSYNTDKEVDLTLNKKATNIKKDGEIIVNDFATLKSEIESLEEDSEATFKLNPENTYTITTPINMYTPATITINGNGATINGNGASDANNQFIKGGNYDLVLTIANITVQGCTPAADGAAINIGSGTLIIENSTFKNCNTPWQGGVINGGNTEITIKNSTFESNTATGNGGVIFTNYDVTISDSKFINNKANANNGGGGVIRTNGGYLTVTNSSFESGSVNDAGGAIYANNAEVSVTDSVFNNNYAYKNGGAISAIGGSLTVDNCIFQANTIYWNGGAICTDQAEATVSNSKFENNYAYNQGGATYSSDDTTITNCSFTNNLAYAGGAVYHTTGDLTIDSSVFDGNHVEEDGNAGAIYVYDEQNTGHIFTLKNSNITNSYLEIGSRAGAVYIQNMNTTIDNSIFKNNNGNLSGGAIVSINNNISINNSNFDNNKATETAAAIYSEYGILTINNSNFTNHKNTTNGPAIYTTYTQLNINNSNFENNSGSWGGSIYGGLGENITINNSKFTNNIAETRGGAILAYSAIKVYNSEFTNNTVNGYDGGAIYANPEIAIDNSTFTLNSAPNGGAVYVEGQKLQINNSKFNNNNATSNGPAIYSTVVTTIDNSTFDNNTAPQSGTVYVANELTVNNSKFTNNHDLGVGGAIYTNNKASIYNSEFTNNSAVDGGALYEDNNGEFKVENSTFINNHADYSGGAIYAQNKLAVNHSNFSNNKGEVFGGVVYFIGGNLTIDESVFDNNTANEGVLIYPENANVSLTNSNITIDENYIKYNKVIEYDNNVNITKSNNIFNGVNVDDGYVKLNLTIDNEYLISGEENNITGTVNGYQLGYGSNYVTLYVDGVEQGNCSVTIDGTVNFTYTPTHQANTTLKFVFKSLQGYYTTLTEEKTVGCKVKTTMTLTSDEEVYENTAITVTGTLTDNTGAITDKQVNIYVNDELNGVSEATDSEGKFTYTFTANDPGLISIYAQMDDDESYVGSKSNTVEVTNKVATEITLNQITDTKVNEETTITGTLKYGENALENQVVTISIDDESFETNPTDENGAFTYTFTPATPGTVTLTAKFNANSYYLASNEASMDIKVKSDATLTIDNFDEGFYVKINDDDSLLINATLKDDNNNPIANKEVKIFVNEAQNKTLTTNDEGKVTYTFTPDQIGKYIISASFDGDEIYSQADSDITTVSVKTDTKITLDAIENAVNIGDKITFTGKLTDINDNAISAKEVYLKVDNVNTPTVQTADDGTFSVEYETTVIGSHPVIAYFDDNEYYLASNSSSSTENIIVNMPSKLTLNDVTSPVTIGTDVTISGKLTDIHGNPLSLQTVVLYINDNAVDDEITTDSEGIFTYSYTTVANGINNVKASYAGENFILSNNTDNTKEFTVNTPTTIKVDEITNTVKVNDEIAITVELKDSYNNIGLSGQNVIIKADNEIISGTVTDNNDGTYTVNYVVTTAGEHVFTAEFEEANYYLASQDTTGQTINVLLNTAVTIDAVNTTVDKETTITATVTSDNQINEGQITFTLENGTVLATVNVENSQATTTYTFTEETDTTITATFTQTENYAESTASNTLKVNPKAPPVLKIDTTEFVVGETTQLKATIYQEDEVLTTLNKGKVVFKVNGKTVKDASGKVIYAKVVNGTATINDFEIPDSWNVVGSKIQAVYFGTGDISKITSEKVNITFTPSEFKITTNDITAKAGDTITLNATIKATAKLNTGKVIFKINGKTLKDANGKVIYAHVINNTVSVEYTLPETYKAKSYTLTATYISTDLRIEDVKTLTITE